MSIYEEIKTSTRQFVFEPKIENEEKLRKFSKYLIVGMGGSHEAGDLLKLIKPKLDIKIHSNYGLPPLSIEELKERLIILNSYSGNTEEVLDAYEKALELDLQIIAISIGGKLLEKARKDEIPYIEMEDIKIDGVSIQPRSALILSLKSMLKAIGEEETLKEVGKLAETFHTENFETEGKELAEKLRGYVPVIYASEKNFALAYIWKIKFNENGKIPAFYNVFPELNHNEMNGFDVINTTRPLSEKFYFIFLMDPEDHPKIEKRMKVTCKLYEDRNLKTHNIAISGDNIYHKIFSTLTKVDFATHFTALEYGLESEKIPMIDEFKKLMER